MSNDPYHVVQAEIQSTLQTAVTLLASYRRIRSTARADSEELGYARNELKATLSSLEADLDDLEESVRVVETSGGRTFGIGDAEVATRRRYVLQVRRELENLRAEVTSHEHPYASTSSKSAPRTYQAPPITSASSSSSKPVPPSTHPLAGEAGVKAHGETEEDDQAEWSRIEQQMLMREQDRTLDTISGTLTTLAEQAGLMGHEIAEHVEMLEDLEQGVDRADTKLSGAMKRMKKFVRDTEETKSGWCIVILIIVLLILLLAVILV